MRQPRPEVFLELQHVLVLAAGRVVFAGAAENMLPFFVDVTGASCRLTQ